MSIDPFILSIEVHGINFSPCQLSTPVVEIFTSSPIVNPLKTVLSVNPAPWQHYPKPRLDVPEIDLGW
jgi:hypothetical protein